MSRRGSSSKLKPLMPSSSPYIPIMEEEDDNPQYENHAGEDFRNFESLLSENEEGVEEVQPTPARRGRGNRASDSTASGRLLLENQVLTTITKGSGPMFGSFSTKFLFQTESWKCIANFARSNTSS
ncbi:hypothetical protein ACP275_08G115400 [Erythranthe tilingii]